MCVVGKFNITSTSSSTTLCGSTSNIAEMSIDGVKLTNPVTSYTFTTTGEHVVKYYLIDNTKIQGFGSAAFYDVYIPNTVTTIKSFALSYAKVVKLVLPDSVQVIEESGCESMSKLQEVILGNNVQTIGNNAFYQYGVNYTLTIHTVTPPSMASGAAAIFGGTTPNAIYVPAESVDAYKVKPGWSSQSSRIQAIPS